jgi:hypothetical protein
MSLLILVAGMAALFGLWIVICKLDGVSSIPHFISAILQMFGVVMLLGFAIGDRPIHSAWVQNGIAALLFGIALWLAFDRRKPGGSP